MKEQEHQLQVACVRWFRLQYPTRSIIFAIPNGGQRNVVVAAKMKAEGVTAGVPDLFVPHPTKIYHGLFIEMKNGNRGRLSERQRQMLRLLARKGYACVVARDFDDFRFKVMRYFNDLPLECEDYDIQRGSEQTDS